MIKALVNATNIHVVGEVGQKLIIALLQLIVFFVQRAIHLLRQLKLFLQFADVYLPFAVLVAQPVFQQLDPSARSVQLPLHPFVILDQRLSSSLLGV